MGREEERQKERGGKKKGIAMKEGMVYDMVSNGSSDLFDLLSLEDWDFDKQIDCFSIHIRRKQEKESTGKEWKKVDRFCWLCSILLILILLEYISLLYIRILLEFRIKDTK